MFRIVTIHSYIHSKQRNAYNTNTQRRDYIRLRRMVVFDSSIQIHTKCQKRDIIRRLVLVYTFATIGMVNTLTKIENKPFGFCQFAVCGTQYVNEWDRTLLTDEQLFYLQFIFFLFLSSLQWMLSNVFFLQSNCRGLGRHKFQIQKRMTVKKQIAMFNTGLFVFFINEQIIDICIFLYICDRV